MVKLTVLTSHKSLPRREYPLLLKSEALESLTFPFWSCNVANPIPEPDEGHETPTAIETNETHMSLSHNHSIDYIN